MFYADVAQSVERGPSKSNVARSNRVIRFFLLSLCLITPIAMQLQNKTASLSFISLCTLKILGRASK
jgi:hypothetical protein